MKSACLSMVRSSTYAQKPPNTDRAEEQEGEIYTNKYKLPTGIKQLDRLNDRPQNLFKQQWERNEKHQFIVNVECN